MNNNYLPWIVLGAVVLVSLVAKGYLPFSLSRPRSQASPVQLPPQSVRLSEQDSQVLGRMFADAVRREAELEVAEKISLKARESIKATFTAPFSAGPSAS